MADMYNIEIVKKILVSDDINLIECNVYDCNKVLLKPKAIGTYYPCDNMIDLINYEIAPPEIDNISDLCNNKIIYNSLNLNGLRYENR